MPEISSSSAPSATLSGTPKRPADRVVHIALCSDRNAADGLAGVIASASRHLNPACSLHIHIIDCGLGEAVQHRLQATTARLNRTQIEFLQLPASKLSRFPFPSAHVHVTLAAYGRLLIHELLPDIDRLIYLDCDLLVMRDLSELYFLDLEGKPLAAAPDLIIGRVGSEMETLVQDIPGIDPQLPYLNSGVLLLDLSALRQMDVSDLYSKALRKVSAKFHDQTLLNTVFHGRWKVLPSSWNRTVFLLPDFNIFRDRPNTIWHLFRTHKPWHFHRVGARGLIADYYGFLDSVGWIPMEKPRWQVKSSAARDFFKALGALLKRSWRSA